MSLLSTFGQHNYERLPYQARKDFVSASGLCKHQPWVTQGIGLATPIMQLSQSSARFDDWPKERAM
jgi:hypothetical protein